MKIDSHLHFWNYHPIKDAWITDDMAVLKRDFAPDRLLPLLAAHSIDGGIAVQADQSEAETRYLVDLATRYEFVKGIVGWVDLRAPDVGERLDYFSQFALIKGYRHIVQSEPQDDFLLRADFCRGIGELGARGLTYDVLVYAWQLPTALQFVRRFPHQRFVLDHIGKPDIRCGQIADWQRMLAPFAKEEHVACKIAGLSTEADWHRWGYADFAPYIDTVLEVFGPDRLLFGSDWPVCLVGAHYDQTCLIVDEHTATLTADEKDKLWGLTCKRMYNL